MSTSARQVLAEVAGAGYCTHPVQLHGTAADTETGELRHLLLRVACKDRRAAVCPSCSYLYKADAWILIAAGMLGGKGLPEEVAAHPRVFATLTAPSFGAVHRVTESGTCHPGRRPRCRHGASQSCGTRHDEADVLVGSPLCVDCFEYDEAVLWNAMASRLWHRTVVRLRQGIGATQHLSESRFHDVARVNYLKVAEFQRRGLVHFHLIVRAEGPDGSQSPAPRWLTSELLERQVRRVAATAEVLGTERRAFRWGRQLQVADVTAGDPESGRRIAAYLAKYATKTTDGANGFAHRFRRRADVERASGTLHARQLALTAWDLGADPGFEALGLRRHAHAFGFQGQLITKSRGFSTTFGSLRRARADYVAGFNESPWQVVGAFGYAGRGYSDPRGEAVAELLHRETVAMRRRAKERRIEPGDSRDGS